jgi:hypothetical protein
VRPAGFPRCGRGSARRRRRRCCPCFPPPPLARPPAHRRARPPPPPRADWGVPRADLALVAPRSPDRAAFKDGSALTLGPIPREAWGEALAWAASATAALPPGGSLYFAATATGPGAVDADWPTNRTAYAHRGGLLELSYGASWPSNATAAVAADAAALARRAAAAFSRWQDAGAYLNFVDADQPAPLAAYFRDNAPRLSQIKARYDPGSLFQSAVAAIPPAA